MSTTGLLLAAVLAAAAAQHCGYPSCPQAKEGYLNIHMVPHTHDDVGWLKTYDQYYFGNYKMIQEAGVQWVLDSVVQELLNDPQKRFVYVESAYLWMWWEEQEDQMKDQVRMLVDQGRLEFIGGGWSMHDEACTHYQSILDQHTWGFRFLSDEFGECGRPRAGWQIDPFGHSKESANLMQQFGFDGLFLGRIDWQDKSFRMNNRSMEMIWHTSKADPDAKLFTSVMFNTYSSPNNFCFDVACSDEPIVDNKKSPMYNAKRKAETFAKLMITYSMPYRTNNIIVTMGGDFQYIYAHMNFKNMDKLIKHVNELEIDGVKMNAFYSTPTCYLKAVHETGVTLPTKTDDFMPYSSDPYSFWSGYYTSRPNSKRFERIGNNFLQVSKQLVSLSGDGEEGLVPLRQAMGVMQHHDAITGTEKAHVASDYARILSEAMAEAQQAAATALSKLASKGEDKMKYSSCLLLNISSCPLTENQDRFTVTVYNPLSRPVNHLVKLPVSSTQESYTVLDPRGLSVETQVVELPEWVLRTPGRNSEATAQLYFIAEDLPPLGYKSYYVVRDGRTTKTSRKLYPRRPLKIGFYGGAFVKIDGDGKLTHLSTNGKESKVSQSLYYYVGAVGNNEVFMNRSSGAYIFRPDGREMPVSDFPPETTIFTGPLVHEVHQKFSDWASQVIRVFKGSSHVEFQWQVGPIPIDDRKGKEVISRFTSEIDSGNEFLTDSNGREYLTRRLNYRASWPVSLAELVPGNYYPVTTTISLSGAGERLSVVTDRSQGGSSLAPGQLELMVHRRLLHDDAFGVGEALNETQYGEGTVAVGSHYLTFSDLPSVRRLVQETVLQPWLFLSSAPSLSKWQSNHLLQMSGLREGLPENVQVLTLEPWKGGLLLRLEHIMGPDEDPSLSSPVTFSLRDMLSWWDVSGVEEMTLGGNLKASSHRPLPWGEAPPRHTQSVHHVTLRPMQIRTFLVHLRSSHPRTQHF